MATAPTTPWQMSGQGYEFCNCYFGCGCNFLGVPNSADGSCQAFVGHAVARGRCGEVDLDGVKFAMFMVWPGAIHEGNGKAALVVDTAVSDRQGEALTEICSGRLGGMPWEILGSTFQLVGPVKQKIALEESGRKSAMRIEGVGEARGNTLKNPVTGEDHEVNVDLPHGFIWKKGEVGQGSFRASVAGLTAAFERTNWIHYRFDWSNGA